MDKDIILQEKEAEVQAELVKRLLECEAQCVIVFVCVSLS